MDNNKPLSMREFIRDEFWPALSKQFAMERELAVHYKAMCMLNDIYAESLGLSDEQIKEGFAHCLHNVKAAQLNKTLEQGDAA